jgi:hypothetical protein
MKKTIVTLIALGTLTSCAAPRSTMNELSLGMSKESVIATMGQPDSTAASKEKGECLMYSLWRDFWNRKPGDYSDRYYTCFNNNKLTSFGRVGDPTL